MPRIHKQIEIKAPVHKVYTIIEDPSHEPEWMKNMAEVSQITGAGQGSHYNWTWKMAGLRLKGETTNVEDIPDKRIVARTNGGIKSTWTWNLEAHENMTVLNLDIDYQIPVPILGKLAEKVVEDKNERDAEHMLDNLKKKLEV